jgi:hypothetical protein
MAARHRKKRMPQPEPPPGCVSVLVRSRQHGRCFRYLVLGDPPHDRRRYARERQCHSSR